MDDAKNKLKQEIDKVKELINFKKNEEAIMVVDNCNLIIEEYADCYSRNQNIKKESVKRNERISVIDKEIESWKNLLTNSEKMVNELTERKQKLNLQLEKLDNQPKLQAEKKGQISEGLRISEKEKNENESVINSTDEKIDNLRNKLNEIQEQSIQIRERKASSSATIDGLKKRKDDLLDRIDVELNLNENNIFENSDLKNVEELPDSVTQEEKLDEKKRDREKQPQSQAEKKGQISESLRISEKEKNENEKLINEIDNKINELRNELDSTKENN